MVFNATSAIFQLYRGGTSGLYRSIDGKHSNGLCTSEYQI